MSLRLAAVNTAATDRPRALASIATVGIDLTEGSHGELSHYGETASIGEHQPAVLANGHYTATLSLRPRARITFSTVANSGFPSDESAL